MAYCKDTIAQQLEGIIAYTVTPFSPSNQINVDLLHTSIDRLICSQVKAIASLGSTGEGVYLSMDEWEVVVNETVRGVNGRVPVIIGISTFSTEEAIRKAKIAEEAGASLLMILPLSYWRLSDSEIFDYYAEIGKHTQLPIMLYNNPSTSGLDISPNLILKICQDVENVTMVKESSGDINRVHQILLESEYKTPVFNGCNSLTLEVLSSGAKGWCTAAPNLIPELNQKLIESIVNNNLSEARDYFYRQLPLLNFMSKKGIPSTIKAGMELLGYRVGNPRRPIRPLSYDDVELLKSILVNCGLINPDR